MAFFEQSIDRRQIGIEIALIALGNDAEWSTTRVIILRDIEGGEEIAFGDAIGAGDVGDRHPGLGPSISILLNALIITRFPNGLHFLDREDGQYQQTTEQ